MPENWKNMPPLHKTLTVIACVSVAATVVLLLAQYMRGWAPSVDLKAPAFAVAMLCQSAIFWKSKRNMAYMMLIPALLLLASFALDLFV